MRLDLSVRASARLARFARRIFSCIAPQSDALLKDHSNA